VPLAVGTEAARVRPGRAAMGRGEGSRISQVPLAVGTEAALTRGGAREAADEEARARDAAGARPSKGAACLVGSRADARSSVAGRGEDEDGGVRGSGRRKLGVFFWVRCWRRKVLGA
jgi:hypothetical protein